MKTITMLELRRNAPAVVQNLRRGLMLTLTYRGRPLACLKPISPETNNITADDSFYRLAEQAHLAEGNLKLAKCSRFTNDNIDRALYGDLGDSEQISSSVSK